MKIDTCFSLVVIDHDMQFARATKVQRNGEGGKMMEGRGAPEHQSQSGDIYKQQELL
jgi:ABC-type uncharacterized transport system ATPase subunit